MKRYYSLVQTTDHAADIFIYGDITSYPWVESDVSAYNLSKEIEGVEADEINVYINSYGGEVAEGLAIYNSLKRHKAKIKTFIDGFACSIASVIFMAGDERIAPNTSMLMIHNPWTVASGNSAELLKAAEDLDKISKPSISAYMERVTITEEELTQWLDNESWITPQEALDMGFATSIIAESSTKQNQSVRLKVVEMIKQGKKLQTSVLEEEEHLIPEQKPEQPEEQTNKILNLFSGLK